MTNSDRSRVEILIHALTRDVVVEPDLAEIRAEPHLHVAPNAGRKLLPTAATSNADVCVGRLRPLVLPTPLLVDPEAVHGVEPCHGMFERRKGVAARPPELGGAFFEYIRAITPA